MSFSEFADLCSDFARQMVRATPIVPLEAAENLRLNLRVARTIFTSWSVDIVSLLYSEKSMRFQQIRKALPRVSSRVLSRKLRQLEELSLIRREILDTRPPGVRYSLTDQGLLIAKLGEPVFLYLRVLLQESGRSLQAANAHRTKRFSAFTVSGNPAG